MFENTFRRIGTFSARHSAAVIVAWIIVIVVVAPFAPALFSDTSYNIASDIVPPNSPANIASNLQSQYFNSSNDSSFVIVTNNTSIDTLTSLHALMSMQGAIISYLDRNGFSANASSIITIENDTLRSVSLSLGKELSGIYKINVNLYGESNKLNQSLYLTASFLFVPAVVYVQNFSNEFKVSEYNLSRAEEAGYQSASFLEGEFSSTPYGVLSPVYLSDFSAYMNKTLNNTNIKDALEIANSAVNKTSLALSKYISSSNQLFSSEILAVDSNLTIMDFSNLSKYTSFAEQFTVNTIAPGLSSYSSLISGLNTTINRFVTAIVNVSFAGNYAAIPHLTSTEVYNGTIYQFNGNPLVSLNLRYLEPYLSDLLNSGNTSDSYINSTVNSTIYDETFLQYPVLPSQYVMGSLVGYGNTTEIFSFTLNKNYTISTLNSVNKIAASYVAVKPVNGIYYTAGTDVLSQQIEQEVMTGLVRALIIGIVLSILIVGLFFRSPVAAFLPFGLFVMSSIISFGLNDLLYRYALHATVSFVTPTLLLILLLGLTSDYVVYIMSRYRRELYRNGGDPIPESSKWAGHAVFTSGITVALSYIVLYLFKVPIFSDAGITNAVGVVVSIMLANTFLIALFKRLGYRTFWPARNKKIPMEGTMEKISNTVLRNKKKIVVIFIVVAFGALYVYASTPTNMNVFSLIPPSSGIQSAVVVNQSFHRDLFFESFVILKFNSPVIVNGTYNVSEMNQITKLESMMAGLRGVAKVYGPTYPYGQYVNIDRLPSNYVSTYRSQINTYIGSDPHYVMVEFELSNISWSNAAASFINSLPSKISSYMGNSITFYVGGLTAGLDAAYSHTLRTFEEMIPILAASIFVILAIQLSSVFTPLRLILMVLASVIVGLMIIYWIVYYIYHLPIIIFMPMFTFVTLLAVGLDYDIFMITRAREGVMKGMTDEEAITTSIRENGGIIVTLGSLLFVTFGSLYFSDLQLIEEIGGGLAIGVLIDTFLSWPFFVPAVMLLMKKWNWWPSKIRKA
ncbi:MMPL family transporter [Thermoplasma sp.]|uniref:MMPL family transporter n=1 Tax=Thermoplasma sp. TaxID=1973142 RepID=UPI0012815E04|nr:MMPL family transporter [Thermoplasma sp.]KAA8922221.1 MAG: MMPL family transporter [Thermoplasma sp.]